MTIEELIQRAAEVAIARRHGTHCEAGGVGAALETASGDCFVGVCIDVPCGIGFCAEHAAIAAMVTAGQSRVKRIVAVTSEGNIVPPCGRCRQFLLFVNDDNTDTEVVVAPNEVMTLEALMPRRWQGGGGDV